VGHPWDQDRAREWWTLHAPDRIDLDSKGIPVASDTKGPGVGSEPLETLGEIAPAV
jgi:hypothetical protein